MPRNQNGAPGQSRTADNKFRKLVLYPSELPGLKLDGPVVLADEAAQFLKRDSLDLADALTSNAKDLSGFIQSVDFTIFQAKPKLKDFPLTGTHPV